MRKIFLFIIFLVVVLVAKNERIEIMAEDLSATETVVIAKGNVVVHYGDSVIQASTANYDREKQLLTLSGDTIEYLGDNGSKIQSKNLQINTKSKKVTFKNVFLTDNSDIWVFSDNAIKQDDNITFGPSMMSSCDVNSKDWTFYSKSAHYDGEAHYMTMRDLKVKFWDVPVLYTPYFAFSTHKERSSGLLFPSVGYSASQGAIYEQPLYWAPSLSWDVELRPQIRTKRGVGMYGTLRFADSPYSAGAIRMGYFKDNEEYMEEYDIKNESHYGFEMNYESTRVIKRFFSPQTDLVDGLYINATLLNDIDYIYLQKRPMSHFGAVPLQESRVNYFVHNEDFAGGLYGKYFIDTRKEDNNSTMQILPTLQFHKYLKSLVLDRLTYSMDLTMNNYTRKEGTTLKVAEFYTPIEYTHPFFDDFITLSLKEDLYYNTLLFGNGDFAQDDYQYSNAISRIKLFSDLTKKYSHFIHVMQPALTYSIPANGVETPVEFEELEEDQKKLFAPGIEEQNIALKFSQYFYDDFGKIKFYERFTQQYLPENEENKLGNLYHEMQYNLEEWRLYSNLVYSYEFDKVEESLSRISWRRDAYSAGVSHSYERNYSYGENDEVKEYKRINDINLRVGLKITNRISVLGGLVYDLDSIDDIDDADNVDDIGNSQYLFGINYNKDCWNLALGVRQEVRPIETTSGADSILDNVFTFQLNFVPFGGVGVSSDMGDNYQ